MRLNDLIPCCRSLRRICPRRWWPNQRSSDVVPSILQVDATQGVASIIVPQHAIPGVTRLAIDVGRTRRAMLTLPRQANCGDTIRLMDEGLKGWRCDIIPARRPPNTLRAMVPGDAVPGISELHVDTLDGQMISFPVPVDAQPGDTVLLTRGKETGQWSCKVQKMTHDVSPPSTATPEEDMACHDKLRSAILGMGGTWSRKLARGTSPPLAVPGVLATEPILAGEDLGSVPSALFVTPQAVRKQAPKLCHAVDLLLNEMPQEQLTLPSQVAFMTQMLAVAEQRKVQGHASRASCGCSDVWEAFADVLACETLADHPYRLALRDPSGFRAMVDPSPEAEIVERLAWGVLSRYEVIAQKVDPALLGAGFTAERFLRAWLLVVTRAFEIGGGRTTLIPGMDCFNHRPLHAGVEVRWDAAAGRMLLKAKRDIAQGEEVFISYGPLCNPMLFRTYGFTLPPEEEPGWTYVSLPASAQQIMRAHLPSVYSSKVIEFDSRQLHQTIISALEAATGQSEEVADKKQSAKMFLKELLTFRRDGYSRDTLLRPTLEDLERTCGEGLGLAPSRDIILPNVEGAGPAIPRVGISDALRVKLSEYLCLTGYLEALNGEGHTSPLFGDALDHLRRDLQGVIAGVGACKQGAHEAVSSDSS
mmetsp:Transcript_74147/g.217587  ORF Transcript_74147/g.217587 Transcript_74147/m.217587 type:complete len:646 (+) Transcript_74147:66-2003(+)